MTRLLGIAVAVPLLAGGCMFPQGWHWPRLGTDTAQTWVYVQNDVVGYQGPPLAWAVTTYTGHPELAVRLVDRCPTGVNCIVVRTGDLAYPATGRTTISIGSARHLLTATVVLDPIVGVTANARITIFHEMCHALGGGFTPPGEESIHEFCGWPWRTLIFREIARIYHDDSG